MTYTVVVTSFNSINTIRLVIESIGVLQPPPNQVLVIDDASEDGSSDLIKELISKKPQFCFIENEQNLGQSFSRNLGVEKSANEFIIFQDDDDVSLPERASIHIEALEKGVDFSYVSSKKLYPNGYEVLNLNSDVVSSDVKVSTLIRSFSAGFRIPNGLKVYSPSCTLAVRKSAFEAVGGFSLDLRRLEDIDLACRALLNGAQFAWSSKIGVERLHTLGSDKSPTANSLGELRVLTTTRKFLSPREFFVARQMIALRAAYFNRSRLQIAARLALIPILLILSPSKILSVTRRFIHDMRQHK